MTIHLPIWVIYALFFPSWAVLYFFARLASEKKLQTKQQVQQPIIWICFHCGFETSDRDEAESHFGDMDDFEPLCKHWSRMTAEDRAGEIQSAIQELNGERRRVESLQIANEGLQYRVDSLEASIQSYKPFRECRNIHDVWCLYDSMEGRALAAEERLKKVSTCFGLREY